MRESMPTTRLFRLLGDGGDTAAPGNTSMRAMANCVGTVPPNGLRIGDLLRIYAAVGKGSNSNTSTDTIQVALYAGPNGNLTDTAIGSFGITMNTGTTSGWSTEWRIISNTTMRKQGAGSGFSSMSAQISNVRPAIDTIPSIVTGFKLTLAAAMNVGTADWCVVQDFRIYIER
jgi:hypothetical protein